MRKAFDYKLDLINDVSGLSYDKNTINFLKRTKLPFVLHHMKELLIICKSIQVIKMFY